MSDFVEEDLVLGIFDCDREEMDVEEALEEELLVQPGVVEGEAQPHPPNPAGDQSSNQSVEDASALVALLADSGLEESVPGFPPGQHQLPQQHDSWALEMELEEQARVEALAAAAKPHGLDIPEAEPMGEVQSILLLL